MKTATKIELGKTYIVKDIKGRSTIHGLSFVKSMEHMCGKEIVFEEYNTSYGAGVYEGWLYTPGMLLDPEPEQKGNLK